MNNKQHQIVDIEKKLQKMKPGIPGTYRLFQDCLEMENLQLYYRLMGTTINLYLINKKISYQHHSILCEEFAVANNKYKEKEEKYRKLMQNCHAELWETHKEVSKKSNCIKRFDLGFIQSCIRLCFKVCFVPFEILFFLMQIFCVFRDNIF